MNTAHRWTVGAAAVVSLLLTGCVSDIADLEDEALGEAVDAHINLNSLDLGAMNLASTRLNPLRPTTLPVNAKTAIEEPGKLGDQARRVMRYIVECAQPAGTSFEFIWIDRLGTKRKENYPGGIGLAPGWMNAPATPEDVAWVSACLISKANRYGAVVQISSRGSAGALSVYSVAEVATFTHLEGAFWGDLFTSPPVAYSCTNPAEQAYAVAQKRECASGIPASGTDDGCGNTVMVGDCVDHCAAFEAGLGYFSGCFAATGDPETDQVVTVYLE